MSELKIRPLSAVRKRVYIALAVFIALAAVEITMIMGKLHSDRAASWSTARLFLSNVHAGMPRAQVAREAKKDGLWRYLGCVVRDLECEFVHNPPYDLYRTNEWFAPPCCGESVNVRVYFDRRDIVTSIGPPRQYVTDAM